MAIPAGSTRVAILGTNISGEIFETGFWVQGATIASNSDANAFATAVAASAAAGGGSGIPWLSSAQALINNTASYTEIRVYHYTGGTSAAYIGSANFVHAGTHAGDEKPLQCCLVVSLRTAHAGRSYRGRMYIPATAVALATDHQASGTQYSDMATGTAEMFRDLLSSAGATGVVVSQTLTSREVITQVVCDSKVDIQRRRANKEAASHTTTVVI